MNVTHRRNVLAGISGIVGTFLMSKGAAAQYTEQEVRNGATVTSTGDVDINQSASGSQSVVTDINGVPITGDGVYSTNSGQVIVNGSRVTSTGDVDINQSASGSQSVDASYDFPTYDGQPAGQCSPGAVLANPDTGQVFYQANDCCWYAACANRCQKCESCG